MIRIVTFVGDLGIGGETVDQFMGKSDVVALSGRPDQTDRKAESFGGGMDFGACRQATGQDPGHPPP